MKLLPRTPLDVVWDFVLLIALVVALVVALAWLTLFVRGCQ